MIVVRPATPDDADTIREVDALATAALRETYRPKAKALANKDRIRHRLNRLVAVLEGRVVGTTQYWNDDGSIRVIGLGVHSDFRRRGIAKSLIESLAAIGNQEGAQRLLLHTVKETGNAETFRKLGFTVISEEEDTFSESDTFQTLTDVQMEKRIEDPVAAVTGCLTLDNSTNRILSDLRDERR